MERGVKKLPRCRRLCLCIARLAKQHPGDPMSFPFKASLILPIFGVSLPTTQLYCNHHVCTCPPGWRETTTTSTSPVYSQQTCMSGV